MFIPEAGAVFENKYRLIQPLGRGGFAGAYLAEDIETHEKVVLKLPDITQLGDPAVYERFRREMAIGKLLNHPDLPIALEISEGNPPFLALKYIEGESLAKVLHEQGKFPMDQAVTMVIHLLDALDHCHRQGIYHRDLKPENLLLAPDGHLKVIDFGIAVMEGSPRVTWRGFSGLMGTPEYMAPEQIKGERGGARSDIYAVGCLMYHLLSGAPPFTGDNPLTVMYQHMTADLKPLTELLPDLHPGIWAATRRALRRRKEERYNSAAEMADDLKQPQNADLKWINEPDPPMASVLPDKKTNWVIIGGGVVLAVILALLLVFLRKP
ncbi:MAG TPA: serine/threonine-protein kinase [Bacillota bacterium]|nr:serine/threonine-protein kinase [Bacillota bacterium]